jgi:hypothetical protein
MTVTNGSGPNDARHSSTRLWWGVKEVGAVRGEGLRGGRGGDVSDGG